jgi:hypothetical protein
MTTFDPYLTPVWWISDHRGYVEITSYERHRAQGPAAGSPSRPRP